MNNRQRHADLIQPEIPYTQDRFKLHDDDNDVVCDLDFMDRMYDAAFDMSTDDWDACLP
jgi:hypothetical protein